MRRIFVGVAMLVSAGPAAACLNDGESASHEREFRSQYGGKRDLPPPPPPEPPYRPGVGLLVGVGLVGIVGAGVLALSAGRVGKS